MFIEMTSARVTIFFLKIESLRPLGMILIYRSLNRFGDREEIGDKVGD